jgi:hypothetical protein
LRSIFKEETVHYLQLYGAVFVAAAAGFGFVEIGRAHV